MPVRPKSEAKEARIRIIRDEILKGVARYRLLDKYCDLWDLSTDTIDYYIKEAHKQIREAFANEKDNILEANIQRLWDIYNSAEKEGNRKDQIAAMNMINKLAGLYIDRQESTIKIEDYKFKFE